MTWHGYSYSSQLYLQYIPVVYKIRQFQNLDKQVDEKDGCTEHVEGIMVHELFKVGRESNCIRKYMESICFWLLLALFALVPLRKQRVIFSLEESKSCFHPENKTKQKEKNLGIKMTQRVRKHVPKKPKTILICHYLRQSGILSFSILYYFIFNLTVLVLAIYSLLQYTGVTYYICSHSLIQDPLPITTRLHSLQLLFAVFIINTLFEI